MRVALEAGTHSPWISRVLGGCTHEVLVANARKLGLIYAEGRKNDRLDAENLARLARLDARLLSPIEHRGEASQAHLAVALDPVLETIASLTERIRGYDRRLEALSRELYPETALLRQVGGVGPITALTFVLVLEDAARFGRSRSVGAYLGLASGQRQSGESDPQERISKRGEELLRKLLVQGAHYVLGPSPKTPTSGATA
jgi:transposase